jgi:hypothetical protein
MMGDYTEFLRIQSQNAQNRRRKKNKKLRENNKKSHRRLDESRMNDYSLAPLGYAGLYDPGSIVSKERDYDPYQPRGRDGRWVHVGGFSNDDVDTYWNYSADGFSNDISPMLRGHEMPYAPYDDEEMENLNNIVGAMDKIGSGWELKEPMSVYRVAPLGDLKEGDEITDAAFQSTTEHGVVAEKYKTTDEDALLRIDLPKGFRAIPHYGEWENGAKGEVILPRGTKLRVVGKDGKFTVVVPVNSVAKRFHFDPRQPRDRRGRWSDTGLGMDAPNARRMHRDDVSPFPTGQAPSRRRAASGARAATPAKKTAAKKATAAPAKKVAAKKTTTAPAKKTVASPRRASSSSTTNSLYDSTRRTVSNRSDIPRINRGGTHVQQHSDGTPLVPNPYGDPGEAYYARNAGPKKITNARLKTIFEDPSKMTAEERRMISSAGGAKSLDGEDMLTVQTSRGPRDLERYKVMGQLRSKIAPGSGDRSAQREGISSERREKMAAKRRESGKVSSTEFGKISEQISEDWSTDGGKTVPCVFCGKPVHSRGMSVETPKPKALGGNYKDRGGRWPAHETCNTKAGAAAQKDPIAYQEEMMKRFAKLPAETRVRLPHVYDYFPQLGTYPGTAAQRRKYMKTGPKS